MLTHAYQSTAGTLSDGNTNLKREEFALVGGRTQGGCQAYEHKVHAQFTDKCNEHAHGMSNIFEHKVHNCTEDTVHTTGNEHKEHIVFNLSLCQCACECACERELALLFSQICDFALEISWASCAHGSLCPVSDAH